LNVVDVVPLETVRRYVPGVWSEMGRLATIWVTVGAGVVSVSVVAPNLTVGALGKFAPPMTSVLFA
jgi:hypothetical protein